MNIGQVLRKIRVNKNNSQKEMAAKLGISQNYLSLIESNKKEHKGNKKLGYLVSSIIKPYKPAPTPVPYPGATRQFPETPGPTHGGLG